jgi:hypothetical protein
VIATMPAPKKTPAPAFTQEELPLISVLAHTIFPGRKTLYVFEVADALSITDAHVISLINEGLLDAIEVTGKGNKTSREHWRIPVSAYDDYLRRRRNQK